MTEQILNEYLTKNISYLFTISLYDTPLYTSLRKYIVNTYFYNEEDNYLSIMLSSSCLNELEVCINSKVFSDKIHGYINHEVIGNYIILKVDRTIYITDEVLIMLENSDYESIKNTELYKRHICKLGIQKEIVDNTEELKELLEERFNSIVNKPWKLFNKNQETLTLNKIIDMNTELKIQKAWLQSKIENSDYLSKFAYEDVLNNAVPITSPSVISLGNQNKIDYEEIYKKLKEALIKKCGKPQYNININGTKYPLMCSYVDFKNKLSKVIRKYKLEDIDKITNILIDHINKLQSPLLKYYIEKDNTSSLAGDYECYVETKPIVTKIETKDIF